MRSKAPQRSHADPFVGRNSEMGQLDAVLADAHVGVGRVVALQGEPGAGKTRLARWFAPHAEAQGFRVAWAVCAQSEAAPPFWPWSQALRALLAKRAEPLPPHLSLLGELVPELGNATTTPDDPQHARFLLFAAVAEVLRELSAEQPLALVLDDIHAADPGSMRLLLHLAPHLYDMPVVVVATCRTVARGAGSEQSSLLDELAVRWLDVAIGPLDADDVRAFMESHAGVQARPELAEQVRKRTGGNAFFVDRLVRSITADGVHDLETVTPASVRALIAQRLRPLDAQAQSVLAAFAVLDRPSTPSLVAVVCGLSILQVLGVFEQCQEDGLIQPYPGSPGEFMYRHSLVASAVYDDISPIGRAKLHAAAAQALSEEGGVLGGGRTAEVARHWTLAAALGDEMRAKALHYATLAGEQSMRAGAWETAAQWFGRAASMGATGEAQTSLLVALGRAELASGRPASARVTLDHAASLARQQGAARALGHAALAFARTGEAGAVDPEAASLLREAAAALRASDALVDDRKLEALLLSAAAKLLWSDPSAVALRDDLSRRALAVARASDDRTTLIEVVDARLSARAGPEGLAERLEAVEELVAMKGELAPAQQLILHRWRLNALLQKGRVAVALQEINAYEAVAKSMRLPQFIYNAALRRCFHPFLEGRLTDAAERLDEARALGHDAGDSHADAAWSFGRTLVACYTGPEETKRLLPEYEQHADRLSNLAAYQAARLLSRVRAGDQTDVGKRLALLTKQVSASSTTNMFTLATYAIASEVCVALGDVECAKVLLELQMPYVDQAACVGAYLPMGAVAGHAANLAALVGDDRADALAAAGVAMNSAMGAIPWLPRTAVTQPVAATSDGMVVVIRREDDLWGLELEGRVSRVRHVRGMDYLATLIAAPGSDHRAVDLAGVAPELRQRDTGPILDPAAKQAYRTRLAKLAEELKTAVAREDPDSANQARTELEFLKRELSGAVGLGGRDRTTGSSSERARSAVTRAIRRAIQAVAKAEPGFAEHLNLAVSTGHQCRYTPQTEVRIRIE